MADQLIVEDFALAVPVPLARVDGPAQAEAIFMPSLTGAPLIGISELATQTTLVLQLKEKEWKGFPLVQVDPAVIAMEQQLRPQYETQLNAKLHHWRSVCRPTLEQQEKLLAAGKEALDKSVRAMAEQQVQGGARPVPVFRNGRQPVNANPSSAIDHALEAVAKEILSQEQRDRLKREARKRQEFEKRVGVRNIIVLLDKRLILTAPQRSQFMKKLQEGWQNHWATQVQNLVHGQETIPKIHDKIVLPILNERQQKIWKDLQKNQQNHFFGGMHMFHNVPQIEAFKPKKLEPEG